MIFLLSALTTQDYNILCDIFKKFECAKLSSKSKATMKSRPDCKGSNFRGLRNLEADVVSDILQQVSDGSLPLQKLNAKCQEIKKLKEIKLKYFIVDTIPRLLCYIYFIDLCSFLVLSHGKMHKNFMESLPLKKS